MNTPARLSATLLVLLSATACRNTDNAATPGAEPAVAPPATTAMPADTVPDATMPAPASTMTAPAAGEPMSGGEQAADRGFLSDAARSNEEEIAVTALAMEKGGASVKPLATMLNTAHTALRDKLTTASGGTPLQPTATAPADLAALTGTDFDARVLALLREHHEKGVAAYTAASNNMALSEATRTLAAETLPTLKAHLEQVQSAQAKE